MSEQTTTTELSNEFTDIYDTLAGRSYGNQILDAVADERLLY